MKSREIFGLVLRLLGLFFVYLAIRSITVFFMAGTEELFMVTILSAGLYVGVGWWMLGGAPLLMDRAYPPDEKDE